MGELTVSGGDHREYRQEIFGRRGGGCHPSALHPIYTLVFLSYFLHGCMVWVYRKRREEGGWQGGAGYGGVGGGGYIDL